MTEPQAEREHRLRRLMFRADHRGTREADYIIGGFARAHAREWNEQQLQWFEDILNEQDVDVMGWALGTLEAPARFQGPMLVALKRLDYIETPSTLERD
ncbi:succinate dehydrogenase assembly factor 2 [Polymorphobacter sp.]|uniref:FAD assembly factor SdhE n=1 Tax=Polymorphobacter sp. TaxID=1909290 RepID=UPI003F73070B